MTLILTTPFLPSSDGRLLQVDLLSGARREVIDTDAYKGGGPAKIKPANWSAWVDDHGEVTQGRLAFLHLDTVVSSLTKLNAADRARLMGIRPQHAHRHRCKGGSITLERVQVMVGRWNQLVRGEVGVQQLADQETRPKFRASWRRLCEWEFPAVLPQLRLVDGRLALGG